jgi:hypothetical protein
MKITRVIKEALKKVADVNAKTSEAKIRDKIIEITKENRGGKAIPAPLTKGDKSISDRRASVTSAETVGAKKSAAADDVRKSHGTATSQPKGVERADRRTSADSPQDSRNVKQPKKSASRVAIVGKKIRSGEKFATEVFDKALKTLDPKIAKLRRALHGTPAKDVVSKKKGV